MDTDVPDGSYNIYACEVMTVLKGDIKEQEKVTILIPKDIAKIGEEYFFALDTREGSTNYRFSSKNSMLDVAQIDEIREYIK